MCSLNVSHPDFIGHSANREQLDVEVEAEVQLHFKRQRGAAQRQHGGPPAGPVREMSGQGGTPRTGQQAALQRPGQQGTPRQQAGGTPRQQGGQPWLVPSDYQYERTTNEGVVRKRSFAGSKPGMMKGWETRRLVLEHDDTIDEPARRAPSANPPLHASTFFPERAPSSLSEHLLP